MSKCYYILYVVTASKGLQKTKIDFDSTGKFADITGKFADILAISSFVQYWLHNPACTGAIKGAETSEKIKFVCWNYVDDTGRKPYVGKIARALAFGKKKTY